MDHIPKGFVKTKLELTLIKESDVDVFKKHILRLLLRDFDMYYSLEPFTAISGKFEYTKIYFYCFPDVESSLTYTLGCYFQCMFNFYSKQVITRSDHKIPQDYITSQLIELPHT